MPSYTPGNLVLDAWTVLDLNDAPLTGMTSPADVTLTLLRQSGSALVAASETVAWAEVGATGRYYITFTPQNTGLYILYLAEVNVNTGQRRTEFRFDVLAAGAVLTPSYANAFCSESDIERWLQAPVSPTTAPSDVQTTAFAQGRAAYLMSLTASLSYPVTPATVLAGSRLEGMLREANATGACMDFLIAQSKGAGLRPFGAKGKIEDFKTLWESYVGSQRPDGKFVPGLIAFEIKGNLASLATDQILSGDTQAADSSVTPIDSGIVFGVGDLL